MNARQALTRCRRCRRACIAQIRAQVDQLSDDITAAVFRVLHEVRP